jgi:hypothetical protein
MSDGEERGRKEKAATGSYLFFGQLTQKIFWPLEDFGLIGQPKVG